ncbi:DUF4062 domain-containing protein [Sphingomonas sp.]|uniref:DUF4062 domain-containing protein n=1 Tax=Sphingomonas sp. TaxID=28214 RepID=UPI001B1C4AC3|nr:DUF4062 domain-containing protein [Sphingomonas sp.]MBO9715175.1 DUF4062 domain-containing protein [Sphingomonas sp.]
MEAGIQDEPKTYRAIMVSSTFTDLEAHRREIIDAIHRFGFRANGMEYSGARTDADVIESSLGMVRDSVAYACVIGHKYGQTPHDARNPDGLSITELEFNEARRRGRPILLFLMGDDHPVLPADIETDPEKRAKLAAFRERAKRVDPDREATRVYDTFLSKEQFAKQAAIAIGLIAVKAAGESRLPDRAIQGAVARFIDLRPDATGGQVVEAIEAFVPEFEALRERVAALDATDNRIRGAQQAARQALDQGDLDAARRYLAEAGEARVDKAADAVREAAESLAELARADLLALDWESAAANWDRARAMLAPFDAKAEEGLAFDAASNLEDHGVNFGNGKALEAAIVVWRELQSRASTHRKSAKAASLSNNLAIALWHHGERTGGPEGLRLLDEAVTAYREALTVYTRDAMPAEWAMAQNNLGNALQTQGARCGGPEGLRLLNEAVGAYHDALIIRTQADLPIDWAATRSNLGSALITQAERTGGAEGLQLFVEAVACAHDALTVYTRADMPAEWAKAQIHLGTALRAQGERTSSVESQRLLADAVTAFRNALTIYTRTDTSAAWAATQNSLGSALGTQAMRKEGPEGLLLFADAVSAFRDALLVHTRVDMPVDWAMTQNNLGNTLRIQAERVGGAQGLRLLTEAVAAFRDLPTVFTRADMPANWAMTHENLSLAYEGMADLRETPRNNLVAAEAALLTALEIYTPQDMPHYFEKATRALARIRAKLAALPE